MLELTDGYQDGLVASWQRTNSPSSNDSKKSEQLGSVENSLVSRVNFSKVWCGKWDIDCRSSKRHSYANYTKHGHHRMYVTKTTGTSKSKMQ
jgi:hypothetical protein